ncbi:MAG: DUF2080 family transposase-associated protein [Candidatus Hydrothermarchaeaceae archaeon]
MEGAIPIREDTSVIFAARGNSKYHLSNATRRTSSGLSEKVEVVYEKRITPLGNSAKIDPAEKVTLRLSKKMTRIVNICLA